MSKRVKVPAPPKTAARPGTAPAAGQHHHQSSQQAERHGGGGASGQLVLLEGAAGAASGTSGQGVVSGIKTSGGKLLLSYDDLLIKWACLHADANKKEKEEEHAQRKARGEIDSEDEPGDADDEVPQDSWSYAEALIEHAATVSGVEIDPIKKKKAYGELVQPTSPRRGGNLDGSTDAGSLRSSVRRSKKAQRRNSELDYEDDEERAAREAREKAEEERKQREAEEKQRVRDEERAKIEKEVDTTSRKQKITPLIALQRMKMDHQFLVRSFHRVDDECQRLVYGEKTFALTTSHRRSREHHTRSSAVLAGISSRMGRERAAYTKKALRVVSDMRAAVDNRKKELNRHLEQQQKEDDERVAQKEAEDRLQRRLHEARCREWKRQREEKLQSEKATRQKLKETNRAKQMVSKQLEEKTSRGAVRKYLHWQQHAAEVAEKRQAREDLYDHNESQRRERQDEKDQQARKDFYHRNEALRLRNVMEHTQAHERRETRRRHQEHAYKAAMEREGNRQQRIKDVQNDRADREHRVLQQQIEAIQLNQQKSKQRQANRDATFNNAKDIEYRRSKATEEMMEAQEELSRYHQQKHEERMALRRDEIKQQNKNRMELAKQHAGAVAFKEKTTRENWEKRKATLEEQDREIKKMKDQLRQDKERLAMQTQHLKLSHRKGDLRKLDGELMRLDAALARENEDEE